ncbi:ROK family protein [Streptomyces bambusae]|uniref:ROK family protein n=1 Tax=Streptomyces bambusae TaxID=1550616 RepID=UPI001CFC56E4|nr:ROK family protein [Streptomyces bambusae]MCB5167222.1 ROK family protein [Streptomyces bambusae]
MKGSGEESGRGLGLDAVRSHNAGLVLGLLRAAGPAGAGRAELAEGTGLTPQAVSKISARLRAAGLAAPAGRRASTGGKPPGLLRLVPEAGYAVGLQLDRDEVRVALVDLAGRAVATRRAPLDFAAGGPAAVEAAAREIEAAVAGAGLGPAGVRAQDVSLPAAGGPEPAAHPATATEPAPAPDSVQVPDPVPAPDSALAPGGYGTGALWGVGCAVPGPLDHRSGVMGRVTGHPEWEGFPLRAALAARLGLPVVLDKDTNAAAVGLAAESGGSFAYVHVGTGLGAGLFLGGALHRGARTGAGEFGHQVLLLDGPRCRCGARGCAEVLCLAAVARGDHGGAARVLGEAVANLAALLDVDRVVLGGRAVEAAPETYVREVAEVLSARAPGTYRVPVRAAPASAVVTGAAELVLTETFTPPRT